MSFPAASLPSVTLSAKVPATAVVAVLVTPGPAVLGEPPVDLTGLLERESAKGEAGEVVSAPQPAGELERVLAVGIGDGSPGALRKAGAAVARKVKGAATLVVDLREADLDGEGVRALLDGLLLASYGFSRKKESEPRALHTVTLVVPDAKRLQPHVDRAIAVTRATAAARDLVNTPSLDKTPQWLADSAKTLLKGLTVRVRDEKELAKQGFGGIIGVGQGSSRPPRLIEATYDGGGNKHVVLVGKGITFDTGGLSLKPNEGMLGMKSDMGGGAAVLGTLRAIADLKLPLRVTGLVAAAENMPSGTAQRPGDVLRQYGGTTVEVLNTDAEGRLVLADAIVYADRDLEADVIVDVATLTGAMPVALGKKHAGVFASDDQLAEQLLAAAEASGERAWRMPLVDDYRHALDSPIADLRNIGQPKLKLSGGSITAALFLREFAGGRPWAHLDIAGPALSGAEDDELTKGGTGYGVRLLTRWLEATCTA
ncbi:MAG: Leucyl aminopeptidase [Frankiales bacterium]|jgi:leucyl aminopeptidase|nr:Leucyl aminopeptidase [Frankiales bacterium]